ncbi:MAG: hypothetical protein E6Q97_17520 [Desulfurellales bacterium]|nr:MAG: hypothetical protein E6Q97_17520 [Desulfurellales bacterium]
MAQICVKATLDVKATFTIDEEEARALDALAGYGEDAFIKAFYDVLGKAYMKNHEDGLRRFLGSIRNVVNPALALADQAKNLVKQDQLLKQEKFNVTN